MNVSEALAIPCAIVPDRAAIVFDGQTTSYRGLQRRASRLADALAQLGVVAGDRVATLEVNRPELLEIYFAAVCLDAIYVPLSFRAKAEELTYMLDSASPSVLFGNRRAREAQLPGFLDDLSGKLTTLVVLGGDRFDLFLREAARGFLQCELLVGQS